MQKDMAQIIVYGLTEQPLLENIEMNRQIIHNVVERWHQKLYVVPPQALSINRRTTQTSKNLMMRN